jgi:hypothetical protein
MAIYHIRYLFAHAPLAKEEIRPVSARAKEKESCEVVIR